MLSYSAFKCIPFVSFLVSFFLALCSWLSFLDDSGNLLYFFFATTLVPHLFVFCKGRRWKKSIFSKSKCRRAQGLWAERCGSRMPGHLVEVMVCPLHTLDCIPSEVWAFATTGGAIKILHPSTFLGIFLEYIDPSSLLGSPEVDSVTLSRCIAQVKQESDEQVEYEGLCLTRVCDFPRCYAFFDSRQAMQDLEVSSSIQNTWSQYLWGVHFANLEPWHIAQISDLRQSLQVQLEQELDNLTCHQDAEEEAMIAELMKELGDWGAERMSEGAIICQFQVQMLTWQLTAKHSVNFSGRSGKHLADLDSSICPGFAGKRNLGIGTGWCWSVWREGPWLLGKGLGLCVCGQASEFPGPKWSYTQHLTNLTLALIACGDCGFPPPNLSSLVPW